MKNRIPVWSLTAGAGSMILGSFAPWVTALDRVDVVATSANSWDLRDIVVDLGFVDGSLFDLAATLYAAVPVLLVIGVAAGWRGRDVLGSSLATVGAIYGGVVAFAVVRAPDIALYSVEWGVPLTLIGAAVVLATAVSILVARWRRGRSTT